MNSICNLYLMLNRLSAYFSRGSIKKTFFVNSLLDFPEEYWKYFCVSRKLHCSKTMESTRLFRGVPDIHHGITVDSLQEPCENLDQFKNKLEGSLKKWKEDNVRGVWFIIALKDAEWIPILALNDFRVHRGSGNSVVLVRWLPQDISKIPEFAHTMIGAGAVVLNDKNQILVVCERFKNIPFWKLPGGYVEPGEDIVAAVQREVKEETNIKTEFISVISFRHTLSHSNFGCSDIYFVIELKPLNEDIKKDDDEIEDSKWMDTDEYLNHPMVHENNRMFVRKCLMYKDKNIAVTRENTYHPISKIPQTVYVASCRSEL